MSKEIKVNWIDEMIEREALPKSVRKETVEDFCIRHKISDSTYYYQSSKTDNWKKVLEISLMSAKREVPEVLKVLTEKSKAGDMKAIDMYLNYVIKLAKNLDVKSDGKPLPILNLNQDGSICEDNSNDKNIKAQEEN